MSENFDLPGATDVGATLAQLATDVRDLQDAIEMIKDILKSIIQWTIDVIMDFATKTAAQWAANANPLGGAVVAAGMGFLNAFISYVTSAAPKVY